MSTSNARPQSDLSGTPWSKGDIPAPGIGIIIETEDTSMFPAFLIQILIVLVIVGLILWAISQIPMDPVIARVVRVVVIVFVCIWLVYMLAGMLPAGPYYPHR